MGFESTDERLDRLEALVGQIIVAHEAAARRWERIEHTIEQMNKRWGELAMKMGTLVEDIVVPQYRSRRLYPILSSLYLREDVVKYCTRQRIYALGMGNDTMVLLNAQALRPEPST